MECVHDGLVGLILGVSGAGNDDIHIRVVAFFALLLNDQTILGRNQTEGNGISAVDGGSSEVAQGGGQGVGLHRHHFYIIQITGDVSDFRGITSFGIHGQQAGSLQQLNAAGKVGAVVRDADLKGFSGSKCRAGENNQQAENQGYNLLRSFHGNNLLIRFSFSLVGFYVHHGIWHSIPHAAEMVHRIHPPDIKNEGQPCAVLHGTS